MYIMYTGMHSCSWVVAEFAGSTWNLWILWPYRPRHAWHHSQEYGHGRVVKSIQWGRYMKVNKIHTTQSLFALLPLIFPLYSPGKCFMWGLWKTYIASFSGRKLQQNTSHQCICVSCKAYYSRSHSSSWWQLKLLLQLTWKRMTSSRRPSTMSFQHAHLCKQLYALQQSS